MNYELLFPIFTMLYRHEDPSPPKINQLRWNPGTNLENIIAVGGADGKIRIFDIEREKRVDIEAHEGQILFLNWSSDGKKLFSVGEDRYLITWSFDSDKFDISELDSYQFYSDILDIKALDIPYFLIKGSKNYVWYRYFDERNNSYKNSNNSYNLKENEEIIKFALDKAGKYIALGIKEGSSLYLDIFEVHGGYYRILKYPEYLGSSSTILDVIWTPNDDVIVSTPSSVYIRKINRMASERIIDNEIRDNISDANNIVSAITISPDAKYYIIGYKDGLIRVWKRNLRKEAFTFISPNIDGKEIFLSSIDLGKNFILAIGNSEGEVVLYNFKLLSELFNYTIELTNSLSKGEYKNAIEITEEINFYLTINEILSLLRLVERNEISLDIVLKAFPKELIKGAINYIKSMTKTTENKQDLQLIDKLTKELDKLLKGLERGDVKALIGSLKAISLALGPMGAPIYYSAGIIEAITPIIRFLNNKLNEKIQRFRLLPRKGT